MTTTPWGAAISAALAVLISGCGAAAPGSRPIAEFPSQAALAAISARPSAKPAIPRTAQVVDRWAIEQAPLPDATQTPWQPVGPWETLFADVVTSAKQRPRLTLAMGCVARELGRFYLEHRVGPDEGLTRFVIGGCGGLTTDVSAGYVTMEVPADVPDEQLFSQASENLRTSLAKALAAKAPGDAADLAGFWFGRRDTQVIALYVVAREPAQIKPFSLAPDAQGEVVIEGRLNAEVQYFEAYINRGASAVAPCDSDLSVPRPSFRFVCRPAPEDQTAWIQMLYAPPKRLLATAFAQTLMRRSPDAPPTYEAVRYADPAPVSTPEAFTRAVVSQLNTVRAGAGLRPVALAARESATAAKLAPHYFASTLGGAEPEQADVIALGLLAGWDVGGMIRGATLMSILAPTLDAGRWLTSALEMPIGRHTLFAPDIEQIAFGPLVEQAQGAIGAVVTGYRFHHGNDHAGDVKMLLGRVMQSRRRMGLPPPLRLGTMAQVMNEELAAVHRGVATPVDAMDAVLARGVERFAMGMRGLVMEASSLDELQIPEQILRQPVLHLDIGVTHHKAPGAAWAQYTILVIYAALDNTTT